MPIIHTLLDTQNYICPFTGSFTEPDTVTSIKKRRVKGNVQKIAKYLQVVWHR